MGVKWNRVFLLKLSKDQKIQATADDYREWYQVPAGQKWATSSDGGWQPLRQSCFQEANIPQPTFSDKVMIIAHGSQTIVGEEEGWGLTAAKLAFALAYWGITEIGLLTFKCCHVGEGSFLEDFVKACPPDKLRVGWLKGYRGPTVT